MDRDIEQTVDMLFDGYPDPGPGRDRRMNAYARPCGPGCSPACSWDKPCAHVSYREWDKALAAACGPTPLERFAIWLAHRMVDVLEVTVDGYRIIWEARRKLPYALRVYVGWNRRAWEVLKRPEGVALLCAVNAVLWMLIAFLGRHG